MQTELASTQVLETQFPSSSLLKAAFRQNTVLFVLVAGYFAAAILISFLTSDPFLAGNISNIFWMIVALVPTFLLTMIVWRFTHMVVAVRPEKPIGWLGRDLWETVIKDKRRSFSGGIAILLVIIFSFAFAYVKEAIPLLNPFDWDPTFAEWDRILHGGVDPYIAMSPLFGSATMIRIADFAYSAWFLLVYFFMFLACMDQENQKRRNGFLLSFVLSWIIAGSIMATLFASVGPVYYQAFGYGDQFVPLQYMLAEVNEQTPLVAVELHAMLLDGFRNGTGMSGISAMPSMHVAMSWIIAFQGFRYSKSLGWALVGFALLIQVGSVMLAWHYAIDGYVGFVVAVFCWFGGQKLADLQGRLNSDTDTPQTTSEISGR